uniref:adenylate dimethylallyltransferase (ADP/ATP-dependent) n=2 Tax=Hordeum vulgare subsp. vulgare TaxID=112509 RepID=A0A8I6YC83_HORVV
MGAAVMEQRRGGKPKVVFVLGATATGKSKLAISLAARFGGEVINSDKIQVYAGLPVITNKVTDEECAGVPHHLLGSVPCPDADFTVDDFCREAADAIKRVLSHGGLPVVAGGSNRYVEALVDGDGGAFRSSHDCLFVWLDAAPEVLRRSTAVRVDDMVRRGLVEEARAAFDPDASYTRGVRRAIGLPEMDAYLRRASDGDDEAMLGRAVEEIKVNTFGLVLEQVEKIRRLSTLEGWDVRRVDCTEVLARMVDGEGVQELWRKVVWEPVEDMVRTFVIAEKSCGKISLLA